MFFLLSPAKTLDYDTPVPPDSGALATRPRFVAEAAELVAALKRLSASELSRMMDISAPLAELNAERFARWSQRFSDHNSRPAVWAFAGDVYGGLQASQMSTDDLRWAQSHLVILSGLYGVLRPLDRLQPYRLEMGTRFSSNWGGPASDLYRYWGDRLALYLTQRGSREHVRVVVNLASQEYARAALRPSLKLRVVDCVFEDRLGDEWRVIGFHAKRARGLMARFAVLHRLESPEALKDFAAEGYAHVPEVSSAERLVFRRARAD
jgi:cytoplasmic iron level regulating protein YaaA (DUF328/UPF0246 family)